ncbi:MAG TPA: hypothetical protein VNM90_29675 [Haliangium sp.]|nr:hypothetical protein [Haliangium sp.]
MDIQQLSVKIFARPGDFDQDVLIPIFHRWIRERRLGEDVLLIDVADYRHVVDGPGVMLIGHQANFALDQIGHRPGLRVVRKRDPIGDARERLREGFRHALLACHALAREPALQGRLAFDPGEVEVRVMSRLAAPQSAETYAAFLPALRSFLQELYGAEDVACEHLADPRQTFGVHVRVAGEHDAGALHARIA